MNALCSLSHLDALIKNKQVLILQKKCEEISEKFVKILNCKILLGNIRCVSFKINLTVDALTRLTSNELLLY